MFEPTGERLRVDIKVCDLILAKLGELGNEIRKLDSDEDRRDMKHSLDVLASEVKVHRAELSRRAAYPMRD